MDIIVDELIAARLSQIEQIPQVKASHNDTNSSCSICLSDFRRNEVILILPCVHKFHRACIQTWLSKNNTCPTCRDPVFEYTDPALHTDGSSDDESVDVDVDINWTVNLDDSMDSVLYSYSDSDIIEMSAPDVDVSNGWSSEPDLSVSWDNALSPTDTLGMDADSRDSSSVASNDSSDETDVMNESHITVSSSSDDSEQSDASGIEFPLSSIESSDSDVMRYDSSDDSD